jgi:multidrug efflux pump subunit AcrB
VRPVGLSGVLARTFIASKLTPMLLLAALGLGLMALLALPREEEPQISVPMVDIHVRADGLAAADAVELVTRPLEAIVLGIPGVEHVYSQTEDDRVIVTARFLVGTEADDAILRVHEKLRANYDRIPLGIPEPLIVGRGINDVAVVVVALRAAERGDVRWTDTALHELADRLLSELVKLPDVGLSYIVGGRPPEITIEPDPAALARYGITLNQLVEKLQGANRSFAIGLMRDRGETVPVHAGQTLRGVPDAALLLLATRDGRPVYLGDVARVTVGGASREARVWRLTRGAQGWDAAPAVSLALAKRPGANAVVLTHAVRDRIAALQGSVIPDGVVVDITRDYGETAQEKADELLFHLGLATASIVALIWLAIGWREAVVTAVVIPVTILLTLFGAWVLGFTLNRVSLFALIFSIGILVDDAIVVVENIDRHWSMRDGRGRLEAAIEAVAEVGNPTIIATLTVIVALLPMLSVSGLMGPYMAPIPMVASAAMLFSFFVAMMLTPWLMLKLRGGAPAEAPHGAGLLGRAYLAVARPLIERRWRAWLFLGLTGLATAASMLLFVTRDVTVKLLPFDNKSELAVMLDMPAGSSLEDTERTLLAAADRLRPLPEVSAITLNAGTAAPFNFNGLVRHSFLRQAPHLGDLELTLLPRHDRQRDSHAVALDVRRRLADLPLPADARLKVVEVPPGPPVLATLLAEIYGPDAETRRATAALVREAFAEVPFIVDLDDTIADPGRRLRISLLADQLEFHGVEETAVYDTLRALLGGVELGYSHRGAGRNPIAIVLRLPPRALFVSESLLATPVPGRHGAVELGNLVRITEEPASPRVFRRNGHPAEMVMAELAGAVEAPIYGMLAVHEVLARFAAEGRAVPAIRYAGQPLDTTRPALLWEGEWEVTRVTFRDMGLAFGIALLGIYVLVVGQFRSFLVPLVVLVPVPLTLIGILLGHAALAAPFTAPSMIGFIALAGIIVRNSILLVDFVRHTDRAGRSMRAVALEAGAVRFKPILLTAAAAMIGAAFILPDPIFQGLAVSLLFGLASSTALTVLIIPALYRVLRDPT